MTSALEGPQSLAGENDRDVAVKRLQEAYAEGHITREEMDERLGEVLTAKTHGELGQALASLPGQKAETTSTIGAVKGRIRRRGAWRVPRFLKVESAFGRVNLDLTQAIFEHPEVDIELDLPFGGAKIRVPSDAVVDVEGLRTVWKDRNYEVPRSSGRGGPTIRITGTMGFGRLKIRHGRR